MQLIDTLEQYSGLLTFLITFVYAITTLFIMRANKKAADAALQAMRKDESTRREAEIAELKRAFATSQKTLLTQYETERAARLEAEAGKASMESELTELRKQTQAQQQIVPVTSSPAEPAAPAAQ